MIKKGGLFFLKVFSFEEQRIEGPHRFSEDEIIKLFGKDFEIEKIRGCEFEGHIQPFPKALFVTARKR